MESNIPVFTIGSDMIERHTFILGVTGKGRSFITEKYAEQEGISYEEAQRRMQPTQAHRDAMLEENRVRQERELRRLDAVRSAYWSSTEADSHEFSDLSDSLAEHLGIAAPNVEQVKVVFFMLPKSIIGSGISWGFTDSVVRDDIYTWVADNKEEIRERLQIKS